jgi:hypothetical protein
LTKGQNRGLIGDTERYGFKLTVCEKIILSRFSLGEKTIFVGILILAGVADLTPKLLLPLPVNL